MPCDARFTTDPHIGFSADCFRDPLASFSKSQKGTLSKWTGLGRPNKRAIPLLCPKATSDTPMMGSLAFPFEATPKRVPSQQEHTPKREIFHRPPAPSPPPPHPEAPRLGGAPAVLSALLADRCSQCRNFKLDTEIC